MHRIFCIFLVSFFALMPPVLADDIKAESNITEAIIFPSRAEITRTATVQLSEGMHTVVFEGLQRQLMPETLRISGASNQDVVLGALSHKVMNHKNISDQRVEELNTKIKALEDKKKIVEAEIEALNSKKTFYDSLKEKAELQAKEHLGELQLNSDEWVKAANVLGAEYTAINKSLVEKNNQKRDIDEEIATLAADMNQFRQMVKQTYRVTVPVETTTPATLKLALSYQLPSAGWQPIYDARLNTQSGDLEITQYGSVKQTTGEDWNDVKVTLSTAQPQKGASLPDLPVWRVGTYSAKARRSVGGAAFNSYTSMDAIAPQQESMELMAVDDGVAMKAAAQPVATIETGGTDAVYKIAGVNTILSDGTESKLLIGPFDAKGQMETHIKPQITNAAYLASRAKLSGESVLLPGVVNLFRDKDFVGITRFPLLRPGQEHVLYFGVDNQIAVDRQSLEDMSDKARMLWDENIQTRSFVTSVENLRNRAIQLVLTETIPVSNDKDVEVEILKDATTDGYEEDVDNKKGHLVWMSELAPKGKTEIKLGWQVSWPKGENINGL